MSRYWALWLAGILFKLAAAVSLAASVIISVISRDTASRITNVLGLLVPPLSPTPPQGQLELSVAWVVSIFTGLLYATALYAAGQACTLIISIWYDSELTAKIIFNRLGAKRPAPPTGEPQVDWKTDSETSSNNQPMGYSRRYRPAPPEVPQDDPRHVRVYSKRPIVRDAPEERIPRPKAKG